MANGLDLRSADDKVLEKEIERLTKEKEKRDKKNTAMNEAKEQIEKILSDKNLTLEKVFPDKFKKKGFSAKISDKNNDPSKHKWRNPNDHSETFHGVGPKTNRLKELIAEHGEEACKVLDNWPVVEE